MFNTDLNTPKKELDHRLRLFQRQLAENRIDAAIILQNADLYYFTGTIQQSNLYIPAEGTPILFVKKNVARAKEESNLELVVPFGSPRMIPDLLKEKGYEIPGRIGMEFDVLPANLYMGYREIFNKAEFKDVSVPIRLIRAVKSEHEIELIKKASQFADRVAAEVPNILREGLTEIEFAGLVEAYARKLGHQGIVRMRLWGSELFYGHIMSGPSAAVPSYLSSPTGGTSTSPAVAQGPGFRKIARHEPVLVDYVFAYRGYISDHTRIFSIGEVPEKLGEAHQSMLDIQDKLKKMARPGMASGALYDTAIEEIGAKGLGDHFMGADDQRIRFIGHGLGLELDEFPFLARGQKMELAEGMVIALEPKLIFPGIGVVGIENTHLVTGEGLEPLTRYNENITVIDR